ncbi:hypothetical protein BD626DRAFT_619197 [Schizophyllum amplum]|uniref:Fungal-type protein kinase domain-containing protein n=1 Tax=Schizophyllum amplum TaxID=97359 RepID=A0A550BV96_9AGAR|nr:hypothetical protein BD626DRAFT_619197 [Auriculariopsis ampla]
MPPAEDSQRLCTQRHKSNSGGGASSRKSQDAAPTIPPYPSSRLLERPTACILLPHAALEKDAVTALERASVEICGTVSTLFPDNMFPTPPSFVVGALDDLLYSLKERKWINYPSPSLYADPACQARSMAKYLNDFTRCCCLGYTGMKCPIPTTPRQWIVIESTRTLSNGETRQVPGIALADAGVDDVQWADVLCDVQIVGGPDCMPEALRRLSSGAANAFATQQDRLYHVGLALGGDVVQLACYDRAGLVLSVPCNVHDTPVIFARMIMGLTLLDKTHGGKDPSIVSRNGLRFVTVGGLEYEIAETLSITKDIHGRTTCWRCRLPDSDQDFVVKNVWADKKRPITEGEFLEMAASLEGVADVVCEETVLRPDGMPYTTTVLRDALGGTSERWAIIGHIPQLELRRLVLKPYARPLQEFASKEELLSVLRDSVKAHWDLYEVKDVLHCDISDNNIMIHEQPGSSLRRGLLIDLSCAVLVKGREKVGPIGRRTGTLPFMACDIVQYSDRVAHGPWHDLESFLYVLMIICAIYSGPLNTPREDFDLRDSPMSAWVSGDGDQKAVIMYQYEDDEFRTFLDSVFDPYFDDLKDLVCELRTVILRNWDRKVTHHDVLEVLDRHIRARRSARERPLAVEDSDRDLPVDADCSKVELRQKRKRRPVASKDDMMAATDRSIRLSKRKKIVHAD